jgi:DNA-binding response OmpR family regulator
MWRVLIVDDEPDVRAIVAATLRDHYEVFEAQDGLDALEKLERVEPDFVVMDVMMPLMTGFEACDAIRKSPRFHELPVMFLTALGAKDDIRKGYSVGANLYLTKPFEPTRLLKNVDVFFQTTPPVKRPKRLTAEQLRANESSGLAPVAPGSTEYVPQQIAPTAAAVPPSPAPPKTSDAVPRAPVALPETAPTQDMRATQSAGTPRVMIVDDDTHVLELMRMTLEGIAEVIVAQDGLSAIEKLVRYQPDLLVIDVMLPKMSGYQLCQSLRSNAAFAQLPILVCSAKGAPRDIQFAKRMGANEYLVKPFNAHELVQKVRDLMSLPSFRIRPKNLSYEQIQLQESPTRINAFEADESVRATDRDVIDDTAPPKAPPPPSGTQNSVRAVTEFLRKEAKDGEGDSDQKRKRRLFGFGRSD